jgi:hypothetical protein
MTQTETWEVYHPTMPNSDAYALVNRIQMPAGSKPQDVWPRIQNDFNPEYAKAGIRSCMIDDHIRKEGSEVYFKIDAWGFSEVRHLFVINFYEGTTVPRNAIWMNNTDLCAAEAGYFASGNWLISDEKFNKISGRSFGFLDAFDTGGSYCEDKSLVSKVTQEQWDSFPEEFRKFFLLGAPSDMKMPKFYKADLQPA